MTVQLTIDSVHDGTAGTTVAVVQLAQALAVAGVRVRIAAEAVGDGLSAVPGVEVVGLGRRPGTWARYLERVEVDVVHDHGLWLPWKHAVAAVAHRRGLPRVVTPHGMLAPWALRHRAFKKRLAWALYQRRDLDRASLLHVTSPAEKAHVRAAGVRAPVGVVPHGIDLPSFGPCAERVPGPRRALFLGRLHPIKGLPDLLDAWAHVRPAGWELTLAGPDEDGHRGLLEARTAALGLADSVRFPGPVAPEAKWGVLRRADLFVLPSHTENFGMAVAEALACGVPVLTTRGTPWAALEEVGAGWWVAPEVEALGAALREATGLDDRTRERMGGRGRAFVEAHFGWPQVAARMVALYEGVVSGEGGSRLTVVPLSTSPELRDVRAAASSLP